jgi:hypothetical protein
MCEVPIALMQKRAQHGSRKVLLLLLQSIKHSSNGVKLISIPRPKASAVAEACYERKSSTCLQKLDNVLLQQLVYQCLVHLQSQQVCAHVPHEPELLPQAQHTPHS